MKKKMGRPTDNPKISRITVRLDDESQRILDKYCEKENKSRAEGIREGIKLLETKLK